MKIHVITVGLLVCIVVGLSSVGVDAEQEARPEADGQMQRLLVAKRDALMARHQFMKAMNDDGTLAYDALVESHELLLQAELELAKTKKRRAEIYAKRVENYRLLEKFALAEFNAGTRDAAAMQLATANRIQAEIDSLRNAALDKADK